MHCLWVRQRALCYLGFGLFAGIFEFLVDLPCRLLLETKTSLMAAKGRLNLRR